MPKRVDANQAEIVSALRELGTSVTDIHIVGHGCPDILIGWRGETYPVEIKTQTGKMTPDEVEYLEEWHGSYALLRSYFDGYILSVWLDGRHIVTVQLANLMAVLETLTACTMPQD